MPDPDRLGFFASLSADRRRAALDRARPIRAPRGHALLNKGDASTDIFFVLEGRLQVLLYSASGREVTLRDLEADDMFGEMSAIDGESRSASILALADSRLLAMSRPDFLELLETSPDVSLWMMRQLTGKIRDLTDRVFELSALNVQARLHCELLRMASRSPTGLEISPAPTHAELASRIGTHREAVTREMRALCAQNIIRTGRRRIEFVDLPRLQTAVRRTARPAEAQPADS